MTTVPFDYGDGIDRPNYAPNADDECAPSCGKLGFDSERIVWMCVLPDDHDGECSYEQRAGRLPPTADSEARYREYLDAWQKRYRGQVVTLNRLEDGTRTIEIALDDSFPFNLETTVEVRVIKGAIDRSQS